MPQLPATLAARQEGQLGAPDLPRQKVQDLRRVALSQRPPSVPAPGFRSFRSSGDRRLAQPSQRPLPKPGDLELRETALGDAGTQLPIFATHPSLFECNVYNLLLEILSRKKFSLDSLPTSHPRRGESNHSPYGAVHTGSELDLSTLQYSLSLPENDELENTCWQNSGGIGQAVQLQAPALS